MKRYRWMFGVLISIIIVLAGFIIPITDGPSNEERVVIDYTLNLYSSAACFDTAGFTNNIDESTYGEVKDHNQFLPESSCTAVEFKSVLAPLWFAWFL
ncbi:hypothetical protein ABC345_20195 [Shouchella sp. 1P09AA]|uniref:hypothetical protein n=1 Tax=unclassified Shouchella TaxID=2893065 RepID=UPI0039A064DB